VHVIVMFVILGHGHSPLGLLVSISSHLPPVVGEELFLASMSETVCNQLSDVIIRERIKNMLAMATRYDNPLRSEELESLRNGRQIIL
jgi:hypothetical protein